MLNDLRRNVQDIQPSPLSDQRFDESHERFEGQSNQQTQILAWLQRFGCEQVDGRLGKAEAAEGVFRVLSVGCGSGILDLPLIQALAPKFEGDGKLEYIGIDPNPVACARFREEFCKLKLKQAELSVLEDTVESYSHDQTIDLTHVVHALYYFTDPAVSIQTMIQNVAEDGELVIFQAPRAELNLLADCFWQDHLQNPIWFSAELEQHLQDAGISFTRSRLDAEVDVTQCFDNESSEGRLTLDFIVQSDCQNFPEPIRRQVVDYLQSISRVHDGKVLAPHPVDVFVIRESN